MSWRPNLKNKYLFKNKYLLTRDKDDYLLAIIQFHPDRKKWDINLLERFDQNFLDKGVRCEDLERAKKFTTMILGEKDLRGESWVKIEEMNYYLHGWLNGERELLAMINFDTEEKRWFIQVLRREYKKVLDKEIGLDLLDDVKKLTENLINAAPYQYEIVLSNFKINKGNSNFSMKTTETS